MLFYCFMASGRSVFFYEAYHKDRAWVSAFQTTASLISAYVVPLFASIVTYHVFFFHRLYDFPGPLLARVSKLWHVYHTRHSLNHQLMQRLFLQYGPFGPVRKDR